LSDIYETWIFLDRASKNTQISNFMKIRPVGADMFHAGGRADRHTDMTKLTVAFHNFANAPKNHITHCEQFRHKEKSYKRKYQVTFGHILYVV
jgi:hypothetical protein